MSSIPATLSKRFLHWLRCLGEVVDEFLAPRFVTTLALTIMVLAVTSLAV